MSAIEPHGPVPGAAQARELTIHRQVLAETQAQLAAANEELAARRAELELAHDFAERLAQESDVAAVATCILEHIGHVSRAQVGTLHTVAEEAALELVASRVAGVDAAALTLIDDATAARALAEESTLVGLLDTGSTLYVPLVHATRPLGVLSLGRLTEPDFSASDLEAIDRLADQAVTALAHAFSLRDIRRIADLKRAVLDATTDAIRVVDLAGKTMLVNKAMQQLGAQLDGDASFWDATTKLSERTTDPAAEQARLDELAADPDLEGVDTYQMAESGAWLQRFSGPVRDAQHRLLGRIFVIRDITIERNAQQLRSDLVATVSHELRTPLTGILGFAELLAMDDLDEATRHSYIETVRRESIRLRDLINDFLDLQRIEEGGFELQLEPVAMAGLLREQAALFERQSEVHTFELALDEGVEAIGESNRLAQVIANLFSNAIKFSPDGGVVTVRAFLQDATVRVEVTDSGIGIAPDQQRQIFEKFFRADSTSTRRIGGTGLGLALSRDIVEAHMGSIGFSSVEGEGATFWFELPGVPEVVAVVDRDAAPATSAA